MKKTKISGYFIFISFFTLVTILVTIIQKSYSNLITPSGSVNSASYASTIDPNLELDVIDEIEKRPINFDETSLPNKNSSEEATVSSEIL